MAAKSRRAVARGLREAINAYRAAKANEKLGTQARRLLARLAESPEAAEAFERLRLRHQRAAAGVLSACIDADDVARTFSRRITKQKDVFARARRWDDAVAVLRRFVAEVSGQEGPLHVGLAGLDLWSPSIFRPPAENADLEHALDLIESYIEWRRGIAEANIAHLGATRDLHIRQAAENAAIWVLAAGVYEAGREPPRRGKHHHAEVADLAEVILDIEVTKERVRQLTRKRRQLYLEMTSDQTGRHLREKTIAGRLSGRPIPGSAVRSPPKKVD